MEIVPKKWCLNWIKHSGFTPFKLINNINNKSKIHCIVCHILNSFNPICEPCLRYISTTPDPNSVPDSAHVPAIDNLFSLFPFHPITRKILHEFKYHEGFYLSKQLTDLFIAKLPPALKYTDCLIPVPLHPKKLNQRGFNQAAILAQHLSKKLQIPINKTHCKKIKHTSSQTQLSGLHRKFNLKQAFEVIPMPYKNVTIIDDLYTTGNTVQTLAIELRKSGVCKVNVWCLSRVLNHSTEIPGI